MQNHRLIVLVLDVVGQFILQNTGMFWSDYPTGRIPNLIKQTDDEWSIRCPLYASENLGVWGEAPIIETGRSPHEVF